MIRSRSGTTHAGGGLRRLALALATIVALLAVVLVSRTVLSPGPRSATVSAVDTPALGAAAFERLGRAVAFRTVSTDSAPPHREAFLAFQAFLRQAFPLVHEHLVRTEIAELSLLYEWPGRDPAAKPVLLLAHQDVVPAVDAAAWTHPPFSGALAEGFVWGRGTMDDKGSLMAVLEAVERLLAEGFRPERTVFLAFGHDEESGGQGAYAVARHLESRGIRLEFVLDEGGFVGQGLLPGIDSPVALIGIAEKGYLTVELSVQEEGGHSSRPPRQTAIGILSRAVATLEENPFPSRLDGAASAMFDELAPHLPFGRRLVIANRWLLEPLLVSRLEDDPTMASFIRTTTAPTVFRAGEKENVLARRASATVNLRILPGDTVEGALDHLRRLVDDPRVELRATSTIEPSPTSSTDSPAWQLIDRSVREVLGNEVIVAPYLMVAVTDSRHFVPIADDVYRFFPLSLSPGDVVRFHGVDERISLADYEHTFAVYHRLLRNLDRLEGDRND